ncbi:MAG: hypothetical protein JW891_09945 [Candidatus Lokiarchaeota archaeon]|nr:hypothetical protein [Candidatus Lokiarchaeota archaeon]
MGTDPNDRWNYPKPDLSVTDYRVKGNVIELEIANNGIWNATSVFIIIEIESLALELYNNSESLLYFDVNERREVQVDLSDFDSYLITKQAYQVSVQVDPENVINETNDDNNQIVISNVIYGKTVYTAPDILFLAIVLLIIVGIVAVVSFTAFKLVKMGKSRQKSSDSTFLQSYASEFGFSEGSESLVDFPKSEDSHKMASTAHKKIKEVDAKQAQVPTTPLTSSEEDNKALEKTEEEMVIEKNQFMCIVHRGAIVGTVYICPNCQAVYCQKCAKILRDKGEKCWSCKKDIVLDLV